MTTHASSTLQDLALNAKDIFDKDTAIISITLPRWSALNNKNCAIRLTSGASVLVELIEHDGDCNAGSVYARKPMVKTLREAAEWIATEETMWMERNNAAAAQ